MYDKTVTFKIRKVEFGDGYTQQSPDGLNTTIFSFNLTWENITTAQKNTIDNFLTARGGYQTFLWFNPENSVTYRIKCDTWTVKYNNPNVWTITATFKQVFI
jgi:phage-related protein